HHCTPTCPNHVDDLPEFEPAPPMMNHPLEDEEEMEEFEEEKEEPQV
nr:hypothetical protein [Tanacetum cinerariifolium]